MSVAPVQKLVAKRDSPAIQTLDITVDPGYHVNSDKPKDEFLIPLKLTWTSSELQPVRITYPDSELVKVGSDTLKVFTGKFSIKTEFQVSPQANPGIALLEGKLHYQACDNQSCKRPATLTVQVPVSIQ